VKPGGARGQPGDLGHPIVIQSTPDRLEQTMRAERVNGWGVNGESRLLGREEEAIEVQQSRQFGTGAVPVNLEEGRVYQYRISMV